ncbi:MULTISPECIES: tripartite tricarboxylate transporter TctB family protein [Halomonadaceae]|uniref:tripartite tricarboxylate transporter TctB family protein n=1 Tax=Halomonadaceae TaxID=28256 RepID=UPI0015989733|nr:MULTISPECIES: tripartite tricarboxylate transporter TctB family protein [Halomonas]QJQ95943.1 tripartite tricarboxylate transporter TctB family protein [Halomonas sp. PA5]
MNMSRLALGAFGIFLGVFFFLNNMEYPTRAAQIPLIFATAVGLLSLALIIQEAVVSRKVMSTSPVASVSPSRKPQWRGGGVFRAFLVYFAALLYAYSISIVGYFIGTAAFLGISLFIARGVSAKYSAVGVACLLIVIGLVFFRFLGLNMPALPSL